MVLPIAPGVVQIDTRLGGWHEVTAGYLLTGPQPVLVETGSQSSVPVVLGALRDVGLAPDDLAGIVVTHVHLDHAGGVGDVARAFPQAKVYVHPRGARHLVDPARLVASAANVYGPALDLLYGRLEPTPAHRVTALEDGQKVSLGRGRSLVALHSPGHAKHHMALHDTGSGLLFVGDAVGVRLPGAGRLRPATPPADFDLGQASQSLRNFGQLGPSQIALAHYGVLPSPPHQVLSEAQEALEEWASVAQGAWMAGTDVEQALWERFGPDVRQLSPEHRQRVEALNGIHSNAEGLKLWLSRQAPIAHNTDGKKS